jgi:hypothetical protein
MRPAPFSPAFAFVAARTMRIDGVEFVPGDPIPDGVLSDRRLRQLYEQRKISPTLPAFLDNGASVARALTKRAALEAAQSLADAQEGEGGVEDAPAEQAAPKARQSRKKA